MKNGKDLVVMIGKMKPKGMKSNDDSEEKDDYKSSSDSEVDSGLEAAFDQLVDALGVNSERVDHASGIEALKSFISQCGSDYDDSKDEDESSSGF